MYKMSLLFWEPILFKQQYGFRPKHSTRHLIIQLLNYCAESNNNLRLDITLAIYCDLAKAFDVISYEMLLNKLNTYRIRRNFNNCLHSHMCYGILAWENCNVNTLHRTALSQKSTIRTINNAKLFKATSIMQITYQYIYFNHHYLYLTSLQNIIYLQ